ncbi:hypothetical protein SAMN05878503_12148 [Cereibacter ovatus]|uniref:Uncharacterized protein n=1 Tax=Cereibacter ovatus TaxID=439529 RepID=A0A285D3C2_9RHOB|nr:hypothetical protein [Cereibacter ovatus]SNX74310.1 hypothetical protein SAMN05878503_12148 [Cereibacter ovatus]
MTLVSPVQPPASGSAAAAPVGPRLHGAIDVIRPDRIAGWVIDRSDPAAHALIEVRREGRVVATGAADRPRRDLQAAGIGTGSYGFSVPLDPPLEAGMDFTLCIRAHVPDGSEILLRPSGTDTTAEIRALGRLIEDVAACRDMLARHQAEAAGLTAALDELKRGQVRLEGLSAPFDPPAARSEAGLWIVSGTAMAAALVSLAIGLLSLMA